MSHCLFSDRAQYPIIQGSNIPFGNRPRTKGWRRKAHAEQQRAAARARGFATRPPEEHEENVLVQPDITGWFDTPESEDDGTENELLPMTTVGRGEVDDLVERCRVAAKKKKKLEEDSSYEATRKAAWRKRVSARKTAAAAAGSRKITA